MEVKDLLLINLSNQSLYPKGTKDTFLEPLGLEYIAAFCNRNDYTVQLLDLNQHDIERGEGLLYYILSSFTFRYVGISVYTPLVSQACRVISIIKKKCRSKIVVGGPHVSALMEEGEAEMLETLNADIYVYGEGEVAMSEILSSDNTKQKFIPGKSLSRINDYEYPARGLSDRSGLGIDYNFGIGPQRIASVITSRSCPYPCVFCSSKVIFGNELRLRSAGDVESELEELGFLGINTIVFLDDTFTFDRDRTLNLCETIGKMGFVYWLDTRVDSVDGDIMYALKQSGCKLIVFGNESGNPEILKRIKKGITVEQIKNAHALANKYGIATKANFMLGHPRETREQMIQTINLAKELIAEKKSFYKVIPLPGTQLFQMLNKEDKKDFTSFAWYKNPPVVCNVSRDELEELQQLAYKEVNG